ncbi:MAG: phosphoglucomutase/phosphomannomutase family protein [Elusimicrobia bacterium]|mgnify:CR=1 FL=1|jgi:phosphoglucomutase|nr:phosphoglucomutase/phosphomannomutase family protein [Elusimicrobiota bacterium]
MSIKFGTSGWRGILADEVTFPRLRVLVQAIADYLREEKLHNRRVVIGYDTRFLSEDLARTAASVLAANGMESLLCVRDTPTPVVAFEVLHQKAAGGVTITASHNPPTYSGLKFNSTWGGPALPETTHRIEVACDPYLAGEAQPKTGREAVGLKKRLIVPHDPMPGYLKQLESLVDRNLLKKGKIRVVVDSLWGTGRGYLDEFLSRSGVHVTSIHNHRDVLFGGHSPSPDLENLKELSATLTQQKAHLGLATDGDADRFGIMDVDGSLLSPNEFLPLLLDHLIKTRKWKGVVARSVMTSHFLDAVAKKYGLTVQETAVGFKYIGDVMVHENSVYPSRGGNFVLGGEESGGLTIRGHVPEKDGILACLLAAEIVAATKRPLRKSIEMLQKEVGTFHTLRLNFHLPIEKMNELRDKLNHKPPTRLNEFPVRRIVETDGHKFILTDGSWIGVRLSGTEPVVRVYIETQDPLKMKALEKAGRVLIGLSPNFK